jgi:hypothetical protein
MRSPADAIGHAWFRVHELAPVAQAARIGHVVNANIARRGGIVRGTGIDDVELLVVGRKAQAVGFVHFVEHHLHLAGLAVDAVYSLFQLHLRARTFVRGQDAIARIGEPDRAIRMDHDIVGRVERLAVPLVGQHGDRAIGLVAHHAPVQMLAGKLAALDSRRCCRCCCRWDCDRR